MSPGNTGVRSSVKTMTERFPEDVTSSASWVPDSEQKRFGASCTDSDYNRRIHASRLQDGRTYQVKVIAAEYT